MAVMKTVMMIMMMMNNDEYIVLKNGYLILFCTQNAFAIRTNIPLVQIHVQLNEMIFSSVFHGNSYHFRLSAESDILTM